MRKHFLFVIIMIVLITNCKSTDKTEEIDVLYKFETEKSIRCTCKNIARKEGYVFDPPIGIDDVYKMILFSDTSGDQGDGGIGIKYHYYTIDYDKKTISFYKKNDTLIVTIFFIDNKRFKVIDYADWLKPGNYDEIENIPDDETREEILSHVERNARHYFFGGKYYIKERVYTLDY